MRNKNASVFKTRLWGSLFLFLYLLLLSGFCTQYVAHKLTYRPGLGHSFLGIFYMPWSWMVWFWKFYDTSSDAFIVPMLLFPVGLATGLLVFVFVIGQMTRSSRKKEDLHGTARFATKEDVFESGLLPARNEGVFCGSWVDGEYVYALRHNGPEHICALAPTRSGKGVGLVIPTLLSWPHSVFVLDRKGENYAITAGWRQKEAGNVVLCFDPAKRGKSCSWNALSEIRFGQSEQVSDAQNIALMVIDDDGRGIAGDHFRSAAFELLTGLILHALYKSKTIGRLPCLQDCAHMLTGVGDFSVAEKKEQSDEEDGEPPLRELFEEMKNAHLNEQDAAEKEAQLVINSVGGRMARTPTRELGSIISTANNALSLYRDPIVGENTSRSDFKVADLMDYERPVSLYFITTPRNADRMRPLMRLLLSQILANLADEMQYDAVGGRSKTVHKHRLLLMLDEFPTLGKIEIFESALAYIAGYGMKAYIITQDVQQLYKAYSNFENIISNCHIRIAYAPNKVETAEWLSKMTGQTTIVEEQISTSGKRYGLTLEQVSRNYHATQRPLMTPDEIMRLPGPKKDANGDITDAGEILVFVAGYPVIKGRQVLYFEDDEFMRRAKIAPPEISDRVEHKEVNLQKQKQKKRFEYKSK